MKKKLVRILATVLSVTLVLTSITFTGISYGNAIAGEQESSYETKYEKPDINDLTGHSDEPEEISVSAAATYAEKEWYEYVTYSDNPVASYRLSDDSRLIFYDPYTYTNAMVMDVQFDATTTEFDTMSSYTISHTTSKSITSARESTVTALTAVQTSGRDVTHSDVTRKGSDTTEYDLTYTHTTDGTKTEDNKNNYETVTLEDLSIAIGFNESATIAAIPTDTKVTIGSTQTGTTSFKETLKNTGSTKTTTYEDYSESEGTTGDTKITYESSSVTEGWTELSARVTRTTGSSSSTSTSWSETEGTTVTKTYQATHFTSDGVTPLPWAIVHYSVQMPMKCCLQYKYDGEWVSVSTIYTMLTTIQGTCRAWIENGQTYYEDWGSGEPVVATDFWSQFMTKDQLMNAYQNKLYPSGGDD